MAELTVMSFNLRTIVDEHGPGHDDHWRTRLTATIEVLRARRPLVVGTQEGTPPQLSAIVGALPHYQVLGFGREPGGEGEYSAILIDTTRVSEHGWQQYWLSETPEVVGSQSWATACTRAAVQATLSLDGGDPFTLVNVHTDHESALARLRGVELMLQRAPRERTVFTGDFNCAAGVDEPWLAMTAAGFVDAFAGSDRDTIDSFHAYTAPGVAGDRPERIDWIMVSPDLGVDQAEIITDRPDLGEGPVWPSDHWPVAATVTV